MSASAEKVKSCLIGLAAGRMTGDSEVARALNRLATRALRDARGGRTVGEDEVEDLAQELLVKVLHLRTQRGAAALISEW
jgi:DNA-directed RNA polymerase specialized sigma24 family protein